MKKIIALAIMFVILTPSVASAFPAVHNYSAWQGVAKVGDEYFISSDRNEAFGLQSSISVYNEQGVFSRRHFYNFTKYGWGDINNINGKLYGTLYNYNISGSPYLSKIAIVNPDNLAVESMFDIGTGVAETVVYHKGYFWVGYHNSAVIRRFNTTFTSSKDYPMIDSFDKFGRTQGMFFYNGLLYAQRHGSNNFGETPAPGLDTYTMEDNKFIYQGSLKPFKYGTGQGVEYVDGVLIQNDRPNNSVEMILLEELNQ